MQTAEILQRSASRPLHTLRDKSLSERSVSASSKWNDFEWNLDNQTHGQRDRCSLIQWRIELFDGSLLTDDRHTQLLGWLRRMVWSLFAEPGDGFAPLSSGTASSVARSLYLTVPWMVENDIRWPHELSQPVLDCFLLELPAYLTKRCRSKESSEDEDAKVTHSSARLAINTIFYIWRQRRSLGKVGVAPMPARPWPDFKSVAELAQLISRCELGWLQPLPDEVAIPLFNRAAWFLGVPADDIIKLEARANDVFHKGVWGTRGGRSATRRAKSSRYRRAAMGFKFATIEGDCIPWHPSLAAKNPLAGTRGVALEARHLVLSLQTACCIVLQAFTGMRVSELCGLRSGRNAKTHLPTGVEMRVSATGLNDEFILWSEASKGQRSPRELPWLLGSRRRGDSELPMPVRAMQILETLLKPYRALLGSDRLLVSMSSHNSTAKTESGVNRITNSRILNLYKSFLNDWVDLSSLPDQSRHATSPADLVSWRESKGAHFKTHQLRKTFAAYVLGVHSGLLPAVKRQFHHMSMAITENSYWGSNAPQIDPIHSVSRQMTSKLLFEIVQGRSAIGGKMGRRLLSNLQELRREAAALTMESAWEHVHRWTESHNLHANHSAHGVCIPLLPSRMECWKRAEEIPVRSLEPNYSTREASLCAGCRCFAMDSRHIPYWRERYIEHEISLRRAQQMQTDAPSYRNVRTRAGQARRILQDVGEDLTALDAVIDSKVAEYG
jgi:integrase